MSQLNLLILAAGEGKRIKPIVTSKPLLPFLGKTLLEWIVENCQGLKTGKTVIVVNPQDEVQVKRLFPKAKVVVQPQPTGMAGAVLASRTDLVGPTVVINGDDWVDPKIMVEFARRIQTTPDKIVLTGVKSTLTGGYFDLQGRTLQVVEKPEKKPSEWFKIVLDYFPSIEKFIKILQSTKSAQDDVYEQVLNQLENLTLLKTAGEFYPLKYPWNILDLTAGLLKDKAQIDKTAKIMPGAHVINSYIGPKVVVGHNALVRDSIIEAGSVVGFSTEIARSYVGPDNFFHSNYIGDSVIESGSNFGAGAVLANFRFDHKPIGNTGRVKFGAIVGRGAQVGVNASVMPNVSIEADGTVWPGVVRK